MKINGSEHLEDLPSLLRLWSGVALCRMALRSNLLDRASFTVVLGGRSLIKMMVYWEGIVGVLGRCCGDGGHSYKGRRHTMPR